MSRSREESTFNRQSTYFLLLLLGQEVLNGTFFKNVSKGDGLLLFLFPTTMTKESKETQLLAGPNKRVTKVYSSSKA